MVIWELLFSVKEFQICVPPPQGATNLDFGFFPGVSATEQEKSVLRFFSPTHHFVHFYNDLELCFNSCIISLLMWFQVRPLFFKFLVNQFSYKWIFLVVLIVRCNGFDKYILKTHLEQKIESYIFNLKLKNL